MNFSIIQKSQLEGAIRIDAEYYQPEYLELVENLEKLKAVPIREIAKNPKRKFKPKKEEKFDYIEISEVDLNSGEFNTETILGENAPDRAQWIVENNDVIISMVRPIRNAVSLIRADDKNLVCSSGFAVLKTKEIDPEYLFIYLKSNPIVKLLDRLTTATMYPAITIDDILNTKIYLGDGEFRQSIKNNVVKAQNEFKNSKSLYQQAENLLLDELGLKGFDSKEKLSSVVNFSDIESVCRIDAEYFQPKYEIVLEKIKKNKAKKLGDLVSLKKGIEIGAEEYQEKGKIFIRVSSMTKFGIVESDQKYLSDKLYEELKKDFEPKKGEVLLTKDATPGIAYVLSNDIQGIISGGTLRLKLKDNEIEDEYLALCLNSFIGQMQAERDAGGSVIAHWKPEQIKNVLIPVLPKITQEKISDLVKKSFEARKKSKELLEEAKRKVEEMIE